MIKNLSESPFPYGIIIVLLWFGTWFYIPGAEFIFFELGVDQNLHSWSVFSTYYNPLVMSIAILVILFASKTHWTVIAGNSLPKAEIPSAISFTIFLFLFSIVAAYALFIPLSYVAPNFVQWWYLDIPPIIFYEPGSYPVLTNILSFLSLVAIGPVIEEVLFRGLLLRIWMKKWRLMTSVVLSSLVFGVLHADPIGACAFGIGMCILYLRTQSLYLPILCHMLNNLTAWLIEAGYIFYNGPNFQYTIDALRSEWYIGLICGLIIAVWFSKFLASPAQSREWKLPAT